MVKRTLRRLWAWWNRVLDNTCPHASPGYCDCHERPLK